MARIIPQSLAVLDVPESQGVSCPDGWRKAETAIIRLLVKARDPSLGRSDYSRIIPREFVGYWYLYKDNYQFSSGTIDFKSEEVYRDRHIWSAEITTQQMAQRVPIIETTQPEENLEEISEFVIFAGSILSNLIANLNIPVLSDYLSFLIEKIEQLSSDNLSYLPAPYRPDFLYISFPAGKASMDIEFIWYPFSPITFGAGFAEIDIEELIELPENEDAPSPTTPSEIKTFDEIARENGYIPLSELPTACSNAGYQLIGDAATFCSSNGYYPIGTNRYVKVTAFVKEANCSLFTKTYYYPLQSGETSVTLATWNAGITWCGQYHKGDYVRTNLGRNVDSFYYANVPDGLRTQILTLSSPPTNSSVSGWIV